MYAFIKPALAVALTLVCSVEAKADHKYKRIVSNEYLSNICLGVKHDTPVSSSWHNALKKAITEYNNALVGGGTKFCYIAPGTSPGARPSAVIVLEIKDYGNTYWKADAEWPTFSGKPGNRIKINTYFDRDPDSMMATIMHEMGHNLGIMHTDDSKGNTVPGTSGADPDSIFRDATGTRLLPRFSRKDVKVLRQLYL